MAESGRTSTAYPDGANVPLELVLCTEELTRRPFRPPGHAAENQALVTLAEALAESPRTILQALAEKILEVLDADSAGISLLTEDGRSFTWPAIAGLWQPHVGGSTPRGYCPCGDVLDRNAPLLFRHVERRYTYFQPITPAVEECLVVPFHVEGRAVGTIWAVDHLGRHKFDAEDLRQLTSLGRFASAAYHLVISLEALERQTDSLRQSQADLSQQVTSLRAVNVDVRDARRAALNLMEDAVHSRQAMEALYAALRQSEERYRALFDLGPVAVYSCDPSGVILDFNSQAVDLWGGEPAVGETEEGFFARHKWFRADGSALPAAQRPMARVVSGALSEVRDAEVVVERPDGARLAVVVNVRPQRGPRGEIAKVINCSCDVTELKRAEEALRESDRHKSEFLAMLAHELRNPLAPIVFSIDVLRRARELSTPSGPSPAGPPDLRERADHALDVLQRQVGHVVRLVDDLLDVARISRGKIELQKERVDLTAIVQQAVEAARPLGERLKHELSVTLLPGPVYLNGDRTRLAQIVENLLNNACKFTPPGGQVWLTMEREDTFAAEGAPGSIAPAVVIRVRDTGIGIPADQIEHVFDMFAQGDKTLERSMSGLGIGLTLVQTLTEMHGGTVDVRSAGVGHGSEFTIRLPLTADTAPSASLRAAADLAPTAPLRILIVDDNRDSAETLALLLGLSGHETHTAHDGLAAVTAAGALRPDVILLDIGLPLLNGYEAARRIREQAPDHAPVLVALTGWAQDDDRRRAEAAGFDAHLVKPVDEAVLGRLLAGIGARMRRGR